jgi:acyl carrier protein
MNPVTSEGVRQFLVARYRQTIEALSLDPAGLDDDFDLLLNGVIDSFGILEMISAIEQEFGIQIDLAALDAEEITRIGALSRYIADNAKGRD